MTEQFWWFVARSGGIVALVLAFASVIWGLLVSSKYLDGLSRRASILSMHRWLGGLTVIFTTIHVAALHLDRYVEFSVAALLVPFMSTWKPVEVAAGVIAMWLLVAVQGTSMLMRRLPRRLWKWIHLSSFALLPLGSWHAIAAGTDAHQPWFRFGLAGLIGLTSFLTSWRAVRIPSRRRAVAAVT